MGLVHAADRLAGHGTVCWARRGLDAATEFSTAIRLI